MDLGPQEKYLKFWEVCQNRALKRYSQFFVQSAADGLIKNGLGSELIWHFKNQLNPLYGRPFLLDVLFGDHWVARDREIIFTFARVGGETRIHGRDGFNSKIRILFDSKRTWRTHNRMSRSKGTFSSFTEILGYMKLLTKVQNPKLNSPIFYNKSVKNEKNGYFDRNELF